MFVCFLGIILDGCFLCSDYYKWNVVIGNKYVNLVLVLEILFISLEKLILCWILFMWVVEMKFFYFRLFYVGLIFLYDMYIVGEWCV